MNFSISPGGAHAAAASIPANTKAQKAAQEFEAVLLGSLLESLQKTFAGNSSSEDSLTGSSSYARMGTEALAGAMSAHGGIGIAKLILQQWKQSKVPEVT